MPKQIAVITGAGAGIGRATVRALAALGFDIALLGRNEVRLQDAAAELTGKNVRVATLQVDVADAAAVRSAARHVEEELGPITVWVNAAGLSAVGPILSLDDDTIRRVTEVTYLGSVYGTQAALECMRARGTGTIVNLGLSHALRGQPFHSIVAGAHAAIAAFCDSLRPEIHHLNDRIDITVVHLPSINTPRFGWQRNVTGHALLPVGRIYEPEVAAQAIMKAIFGHHRDVWVGIGHVVPGIVQSLAPALRDRFLGRRGIKAQYSSEPYEKQPDNFHGSLDGAFAAHGAFEGIPHQDKGPPPLMMTAPLRLGLITAAMALVALLVRGRVRN